MSARLYEVRFELNGCTIFGGAIDDEWLNLTVCGHGMHVSDEEDAENARAIATLLNEEGIPARRPEKCDDCSEGSCGCLLVSYEGSFQSTLSGVMEAAVEVWGSSFGTVQISVLHAGKPNYFSAKWRYMSGSIVVPGFYFLDNVWTYFAVDPTEQHLEALRDLAGVTGVKTEMVEGTPSTALDIGISSNGRTSLVDCLMEVARILAE